MIVCYDYDMNPETHTHLFQMEGTTWTCFGHADACGLRAPACFTPVESAVTRKGLIDLAIRDMVGTSPFAVEHFAVIHVK